MNAYLVGMIPPDGSSLDKLVRVVFAPNPVDAVDIVVRQMNLNPDQYACAVRLIRPGVT